MNAKFLASLVFSVGLAATQAASISVNFRIGNNDNNSVDAGESATQFESVDGANWNNITIAAFGNTSNTNNFNNTSLVNNSGDAAATLNTTIRNGGGTGYANYGFTSEPNQGSTGEAGLMHSYLNFGGTQTGETITVNNLASEFTSKGYKVYIFHDLNQDRNYGFNINDGSVSQSFWTQDSTTDADANDDGIMEWVRATGTTSGTATANGNYSLYTGFSGSSFTITGLSSEARATINGFQIVAVPEPSSTALLGLSGLALLLLRRR
ncbi:hypothetical protein NT6N_16130 [Oceaniferula spumae]|uniref:Ice-binding protein C-terminal domain-containing protein n=1 Tax=Oceaniferula spumae TaxID=2979115 RepID=A0AAT9FKV5_9BACT